MDENRTSALAESIAIMARLRAPGGCPWDREQTFDSIKRHTLEETYEVFDAIDRRAWPELKDELGDLLLQVLFYAQMAEEAGYFSIEDVAANLNAKLVRRHPHIFGDARVDTAEEVKQTWDAIKKVERANRPPVSYIDEVAAHLPALLEAHKLGSRASKAGFDWPDVDGLFEKLAEEAAELRVESDRKHADAIEDELGDLFFTAVNLARHLRVEPEFALRRANRKFRRRFNSMEVDAGGIEALRQATPEELDRLWHRAKHTTAPAGESPAVSGSHPGNSSPELL
jgi:XTP/dITP diphosphohydrolase/ATP diphosphatase